MNNVAQRLPSGFTPLEPFVASWAQTTTAARAHLRDASSEADRKNFYDAAKDILPQALTYLDQKNLDAFDEKDTALMNLMLSLAHVSLAIEVQGPEEANHRCVREHMRITLTPADQRS